MKSVVVHVGQPKTGTSFLQSSIALSDERLREQGFFSPPHRAASEQASGRIGSGNGGRFVSAPDKIEETLETDLRLAESSGLDSLLYSSEMLFPLMADNHGIASSIRDAVDKIGGGASELKFVLYIRDPFDIASSNYQQSVKRGGNTGTFDESLGRIQLARVNKFLHGADAAGVDVVVTNYSRVKSSLLASFERAIGLPADTLVPPPIANVNRSLSAFELEVQRLFNVHFSGKSSRFVSDPLVELLPNVRADIPDCSPEVAEAFLKRVNRRAEAINKRLPEAERYTLQSLADLNIAADSVDADREYTVTGEQLEVLVSHIAKAMGSAKDQPLVKPEPPKRAPGKLVKIHLGTHKTGTTSFQRFIQAHRDDFGDEGILVPRAATRTDASGHHNVGWGLRQDPRFLPERGDLGDLVREITESSAHTAIVSSENLEYLAAEPERVRELEEAFTSLGHEVEYAVVFRGAADYAESLYDQESRSGNETSYGAFARAIVRSGWHVHLSGGRMYFDANEFAAAWARGASKPLTILSYEELVAGAGVLPGLVDWVGGSADLQAKAHEAPRRNPRRGIRVPALSRLVWRRRISRRFPPNVGP